MNCVGHIRPGCGRIRATAPTDYTARLLDRPGPHAGTRAVRRLFLADVLGIYDVYWRRAGRRAAATPCRCRCNDPLLLVPAMAAVTEHLGFGVTCDPVLRAALSVRPAHVDARPPDHGRIGWNIVTGYLDSAARGMGLPAQLAHDDRYDVAEEYMQAVYKLWEGSWEDGAVRARPREPASIADPAKVHAIRHDGQIPDRRDPSVRALAAADAGAVPGRRLRPRPRLCRAACRVRLRQSRHQANVGPAGRRPARPRRAAAAAGLRGRHA